MEFDTSTKKKGEGFERTHIEENIYAAELKEVKEISDGQYGKRVAFIYNILDKNVDLALVCYNTKATADNKLGQTLEAHGVEINDEKVDTANLPKKQVRAWVEDFEYEEDSNGKKSKKIASTVSKVKPLAEKIN